MPNPDNAAGHKPCRYFFERNDKMAEFTAPYVQQIAANANAVFTENTVAAKPCIVHRQGSGLITLRGNTNQCYARYLVVFSGNIAIPTGGTVGEISIALSVNGEALNSSTASVTPAAVENFFNVSVFAYVEVPRNCCVNIGVQNINTQAIELNNANIAVTRVS